MTVVFTVFRRSDGEIKIPRQGSPLTIMTLSPTTIWELAVIHQSENDQMYLLDRLGYKMENLCINIVNTSFIPADSMLGVRYVLSDTDIPEW